MDSREKDNTYEGSLAQQLGIELIRKAELEDIIIKSMAATDAPDTFIKRILGRYYQVLDSRETAYILWVTAENQAYFMAQAIASERKSNA